MIHGEEEGGQEEEEVMRLDARSIVPGEEVRHSMKKKATKKKAKKK